MGHIQATGFYMIHQGGVEPVEEIKYGALYNLYAATDARNITSAGWHVPTDTELGALRTYLGGSTIAGGKLKEIGLIYWNTPNTGATNEVGFNGRGNGYRNGATGEFASMKTQSFYLTTTIFSDQYDTYWMEYDNDDFKRSILPKSSGSSIRPLKDSTTLTHGQTGTYTGNDGKIYRTIAIGAPGSVQEWLADNLAETKYRDGSDIPIVTDNAAWAALSSGAMCAYNNNWGNVLL